LHWLNYNKNCIFKNQFIIIGREGRGSSGVMGAGFHAKMQKLLGEFDGN
jgi:hypothetical protein